MNDSIFKGGRGQKAPYACTHLRVPEKIKSSLQSIIDLYKRAYQLNAEDLRLRLENSLKVYAQEFPRLANSLETSKTFVPLEKYQAVLKVLEDANHELAFQDSLIEELKNNEVQCKEILNESLKLGSNVGGKIKKEIRKALAALD
jgi:hypothetical protein